MLQKTMTPPVAEVAVALSWPAPPRAWATVLVLMAAYAVGFVDRQILTLLVEPVRSFSASM